MPSSQLSFASASEVIESWQKLRERKRRVDTVVAAIEKLLELNPSAHVLFADRNNSPSPSAGSGSTVSCTLTVALTAHGVASFIDTTLDNMGPDEELFHESLVDNVERNLWGYDLRPEFVPHIKCAFLCALEKELGSLWNPPVCAAWEEVCNYLIQQVVSPFLCTDVSSMLSSPTVKGATSVHSTKSGATRTNTKGKRLHRVQSFDPPRQHRTIKRTLSSFPSFRLKKASCT